MARHGKARVQPIIRLVDDQASAQSTGPTTLYYGGSVDGSSALVLWQDAQDEAESAQYLSELTEDDDNTVDGEYIDHDVPSFDPEVHVYAVDHGCSVEVATQMVLWNRANGLTFPGDVRGEDSTDSDGAPHTEHRESGNGAAKRLRFRKDRHDQAWQSKVLQGNPDMVALAVKDAEDDYCSGNLEHGENRLASLKMLYSTRTVAELKHDLIAYARAYKQAVQDHVWVIFEDSRMSAATVNPLHKASREQRGPRGEKGKMQEAQIAATIAALQAANQPQSVIDIAVQVLRAGFQAEASAITSRRKARADARKAANERAAHDVHAANAARAADPNHPTTNREGWQTTTSVQVR